MVIPVPSEMTAKKKDKTKTATPSPMTYPHPHHERGRRRTTGEEGSNNFNDTQTFQQVSILYSKGKHFPLQFYNKILLKKDSNSGRFLDTLVQKRPTFWGVMSCFSSINIRIKTNYRFGAQKLLIFSGF